MEVTTINSTPTQQQTTNSNKSNSNSTMSNENNLQSQAQIILTNLSTTTNNTMITTSPATKNILHAKPSPSCIETTNLNNSATVITSGQHHYNSICANRNGTTPMLSINRTNINHDNFSEKATENSKILDDNGCCDQLYNDIKYVLNSILDYVSSQELVESSQETITTDTNSEIATRASTYTNSATSTTTLSQASSFVECGAEVALTTTSIIAPVHDLDEEEATSKDIVTLRNLEITPPPQPLPSEQPEHPPVSSDQVDEPPKPKSNKRSSKRTHSESNTEQDDDQSTTGGRSKRQRRQTQLFQVEDVSSKSSSKVSSATSERQTSGRRTTTPSLSAKANNPTTKSKKRTEQKSQHIPPKHQQEPPHHIQMRDDFPDVIFYEKNDYLAIRNEEDTYYLCQLTENVRVQRPQIKVRWLDTRDNGKTYFLTSHYDKVPQKSILMPVQVTKLKSDKKGEQIFCLADEVKETIMDRLRRSLNFPSGIEQ